jgi:hypothetical protein
MSTTTVSTDTCADAECASEFRFAEAVAGSFCSSECFDRHRGRNIRTEIAADHRFCATCFGTVKDVDTPSEEWLTQKGSRVSTALEMGAEFAAGVSGQLRLDCTDCDGPARPTATDAVIGFQYPTERTTIVTDREPVNDEQDWRRRTRGRWGCACGTIDNRVHDDACERAEREAVVLNLVRTLLTLFHEGSVPYRPSTGDLFDTLREHGRDWDLAIGRSVYADR